MLDSYCFLCVVMFLWFFLMFDMCCSSQVVPLKKGGVFYLMLGGVGFERS